jgi:hypothetical protein
MPLTAGQAMTLVGNRFKLGVDKLNRSTMFITRMANAIIGAFDLVETNVTRLIKSFGGLENMLRFVGIALGVAFGAKAIQILNTFTLASLKAALPFIAIVAAIAAVALVLEDLYTWINGGDSLVGNLIGPWSEWRDYVMAAVEMVTDIFMWFGDKLAAIGAILVGLFTLDSALFMEGLKGLLSGVWDLMKLLGEGIVTILVESFSWIAKNLANVIIDVLKFAFGLVVDLAKATGGFIYGILASVGSSLMSLLPDSVVAGLQRLAAPVANVLNAVKEIFLAAFTFDLERFAAGLSRLQTALLDTLATWGAFILTPFIDAFNAVVAYFTTVANELTDLLYKAIFEPIVNAVSDAWAAAKNKVSGIGTSISGAWDDAKSFIGMGEAPRGFAPSVTPSQMTAGTGAPSFSTATTVNVTVPAGTSAEQAGFLQNAAKQSFGRATDDKLARDISVYGR